MGWRRGIIRLSARKVTTFRRNRQGYRAFIIVARVGKFCCGGIYNMGWGRGVGGVGGVGGWGATDFIGCGWDED